ncbi:MAG: tRNA (adenosine(37)-N6)-threonylcarbamoyltransferase complex ATPase subunit type 1 TsaE [Ruminococcaceae bacterium]|nr:tRNA (adenosine(37)-N6)-threonylcarbamoyltransferase complex ATPase subunit type 1 TsaE [Oscillospiraceae bacterium]
MQKEFITNSPEETEAFGEALAGQYVAPHVFCLTGDLGAGKTAMTRGIARGYGFDGRVSSPTFTIMHVYEGAETVHHFDLYRIADEEELDAIGFDGFLREGISVIEWPDDYGVRIGPCTRITITRVSDTKRHIIVEEKDV